MVKQLKNILLYPRKTAQELKIKKLWHWVVLAWLSLFGLVVEIYLPAFLSAKDYGMSSNDIFGAMLIFFGLCLFITFFVPFILWGFDYGAAYLISGCKVLPRKFFRVWIPFSAANTFFCTIVYSALFLMGISLFDHSMILRIVAYLLLIRQYYSVYWVLRAQGLTKIRCLVLIAIYIAIGKLVGLARIH